MSPTGAEHGAERRKFGLDVCQTLVITGPFTGTTCRQNSNASGIFQSTVALRGMFVVTSPQIPFLFPFMLP